VLHRNLLQIDLGTDSRQVSDTRVVCRHHIKLAIVAIVAIVAVHSVDLQTQRVITTEAVVTIFFTKKVYDQSSAWPARAKYIMIVPHYETMHEYQWTTL